MTATFPQVSKKLILIVHDHSGLRLPNPSHVRVL